MFKSFVVKDLKKHRIVHHELHDFTNSSKRMMSFKTELRWAWLKLRFDGIRYSLEVTNYNSREAFHSSYPDL